MYQLLQVWFASRNCKRKRSHDESRHLITLRVSFYVALVSVAGGAASSGAECVAAVGRSTVLQLWWLLQRLLLPCEWLRAAACIANEVRSRPLPGAAEASRLLPGAAVVGGVGLTRVAASVRHLVLLVLVAVGWMVKLRLQRVAIAAEVRLALIGVGVPIVLVRATGTAAVPELLPLRWSLTMLAGWRVLLMILAIAASGRALAVAQCFLELSGWLLVRLWLLSGVTVILDVTSPVVTRTAAATATHTRAPASTLTAVETRHV